MTESTVGKRGFEPSKITIYVKNRGIVLEESSMALVNRDTGLIMAMGNEYLHANVGQRIAHDRR